MNYISECLKSDYKQYSIPGTVQTLGKYPNCTMPWQQSMLNMHWSSSYNQSEFNACNATETRTLADLDYEFLKVAARSENSNCPGND